MLRFNELVQEELTWRQASLFKRRWDLYHGEQLLATLKQNRGWLRADGSVYLRDAAEPLFTLKPRGFIQRQLDVESDSELLRSAQLSPNLWMTRIDISFANGNQYRWQRDNFWNTQWVLQTEDKITVGRLERGGFKLGGTVKLLSSDYADDELMLLIFSGIYGMIRQVQNSSSS